MRKTTINRTYIVTGIIFLCLVITGLNCPKSDLRLKNGPVNKLSQQWFYFDEDGTRWDVNLPQNLHTQPNEFAKINVFLPKDFDAVQTLRIRSSQEDLRLLVNNVLIYESYARSNRWEHSPLASSWHFIELPTHSAGKLLTVEVRSPFKQFSGYFNSVAYGNKGYLEMDLVQLYWKDLAVILMLFISGLILFSVPIFLKTYRKWELSYLGLFTIAISIWFLTESKMMQFFTGNHWWISSLAFITLSLLPIPFLLYVRDGILPAKKGIFSVLVHVFVANTLGIIYLQFSGIMPFIESLLVTNLLIVLSSLIMLFCFVKEIQKNHNPVVIYFLKSSSIIYLAVGLEITNFYFWDGFYKVSVYAKLAVWVFIVLQAMNYFSQLIVFIRKSEVSELYKQLALEDQLTGGPNRTAFERDVQSIINEGTLNAQSWLTILDLNNLKQINDTYGHVAGDEAIKRAFCCIQKAFENYGKCYRIGGDEFACLVSNCGEESFENILDNLSELFEEENKDLPYTLGVAMGNVTFDPTIDHNLEGFMHRADMKMYDNKRTGAIEID